MYIIKLDHAIDHTIFYDKSLTEDLQDLTRNNKQDQLIAKRNFTFSERFHTEPEEIQTDRKPSDSFRKMMNKVIHRINRRNHFFTDNQSNENMNQIPIHSLKEQPPKVTHSLDYPHRKTKIFFEHNNLKIKGIGKSQNESNLLRRQTRQNPFIKTSISFVRNKQFNKNIQERRLKSFSSDASGENCSEERKENSFILNNTRYCPAEFKRTMLEEAFKVGSFIPKITAKENFKQMQQLLRINIEAKRNKIDIGKKMFHKKMIERQKKHQIMESRLRQKTNCQRPKKESQKMFKSKDKFEPWVTGEDFIQEGFRVSRKGHY